MQSSQNSPELAGPLIAGLIDGQIADEFARKESIENRGMGVIGSSGALVTLVAGLVGLAARTGTQIADSALIVGLMCVPLACFVAACTAGLLANLPRGYRVADTDSAGGLADLVKNEAFRKPMAAVDRRIAEVKVKQLRSMRTSNARKARALHVALLFQVVALVGVAATAVAVVLTRSK